LNSGQAKVNILVLVSGNGSNLQALIDAAGTGKLGSARITAVISNRHGVYALERAKHAGIPAFTVVPNYDLNKDQRRLELSNHILEICKSNNIDLIIYAGFLLILRGDIIKAYAGRMINLHPALLPKFGGLGMYGEKVHQQVLAAGEKESGCTVHLVDEGTDTGPILLQRKVQVFSGDTPDTLAERIHHEEHIAIVEAAAMMVKRLENQVRGII
jgi:phosphoribosylglycinamide formyltransferase-1